MATATEAAARLLAAEAMYSLAAGQGRRGAVQGIFPSEHKDNDQCRKALLAENEKHSSNRRNFDTCFAQNQTSHSVHRFKEDDNNWPDRTMFVSDVSSLATLSKSKSSESELSKLNNIGLQSGVSKSICDKTCKSTGANDIVLSQDKEDLVEGTNEMVSDQSDSKLSICSDGSTSYCQTPTCDANNNHEDCDIVMKRGDSAEHMKQQSFSDHNHKGAILPYSASVIFNDDPCMSASREDAKSSVTRNVLNIHLDNTEQLNQIHKQLFSSTNGPTVVNIFNVVSEKSFNSVDQNTIPDQITNECKCTDAGDVDRESNIEVINVCTPSSKSCTKYTVKSINSFINKPREIDTCANKNQSSIVESLGTSKSEIEGTHRIATLSTISEAMQQEGNVSNFAAGAAKCDTDFETSVKDGSGSKVVPTTDTGISKSCSLDKTNHDVNNKIVTQLVSSEMNFETSKPLHEDVNNTTILHSSASLEETCGIIKSASLGANKKDTVEKPCKCKCSQFNLESIRHEIETLNSPTMNRLNSPVSIRQKTDSETSKSFSRDATNTAQERFKDTSSRVITSDKLTSTLHTIGHDPDASLLHMEVVPPTQDTSKDIEVVPPTQDSANNMEVLPPTQDTAKHSTVVPPTHDTAKGLTVVPATHDIAKPSTHTPMIMSEVTTDTVPTTSKVTTDILPTMESSITTRDIPTTKDASKAITDFLPTMHTVGVTRDNAPTMDISKDILGITTTIPTSKDISIVTTGFLPTMDTSKGTANIAPTTLDNSPGISNNTIPQQRHSNNVIEKQILNSPSDAIFTIYNINDTPSQSDVINASEVYRMTATEAEHNKTAPPITRASTHNLNSSSNNTGVLNDMELNIAHKIEVMIGEVDQSPVSPAMCRIASQSDLMARDVISEAEQVCVSRICTEPTGGVVDKFVHTCISSASSVTSESLDVVSASKDKSEMICVVNGCPMATLPTVVDVLEVVKPSRKMKNKGSDSSKSFSQNLIAAETVPRKKRGRPKGSFKKTQERNGQYSPGNGHSNGFHVNPRNIAPFKNVHVDMPCDHSERNFGVNPLMVLHSNPSISMGHLHDAANGQRMGIIDNRESIYFLNGSHIGKPLEYNPHHDLVSSHSNLHEVALTEHNLQNMDFILDNNRRMFSSSCLPSPSDSDWQLYGRPMHNIPVTYFNNSSSETSTLPLAHSRVPHSASGLIERNYDLIDHPNENQVALNLTTSRNHSRESKSMSVLKSPPEGCISHVVEQNLMGQDETVPHHLLRLVEDQDLVGQDETVSHRLQRRMPDDQELTKQDEIVPHRLLRLVDDQELMTQDDTVPHDLPSLMSGSPPDLQGLSMQESVPHVTKLQTVSPSSMHPMMPKKRQLYYEQDVSPNSPSSQSNLSSTSMQSPNDPQSDLCNESFLSKQFVDLHGSSNSHDGNLSTFSFPDRGDRYTIASRNTRTLPTTTQCRNMSDSSDISSESSSSRSINDLPSEQITSVINSPLDYPLTRVNDNLRVAVIDTPLQDEATAEPSQSYLPLKKRRMNFNRSSTPPSRRSTEEIGRFEPVERSPLTVVPQGSAVEVEAGEKTDHHISDTADQRPFQIDHIDQNISDSVHRPFQDNTDTDDSGHGTFHANSDQVNYQVNGDQNVEDSTCGPVQSNTDPKYDRRIHRPFPSDAELDTESHAKSPIQMDTDTNDATHRSFPQDMDDQNIKDTIQRPFQIDPRTSLQCLSEIQLALSPDEDGDVPLHIAVAQENMDAVDHYIKLMRVAGHSVDIINSDKQTPMHLAVITNQPGCVKHLLKAGANIDAPNHGGLSALHLAAKSGYVDCLKALVEHSVFPVDLNRKDFEGFTPLHLAVQQKQTDSINVLLNLGADVNAQDGKSGRTPIFHAAEDNYTTAVELLLSFKANVDIHNYSGVTPVMAANGRGHMHLVSNILQYGNSLEQVVPSSPPTLMEVSGEPSTANSPVTDEQMPASHGNQLPLQATNDGIMSDASGNTTSEGPIVLTTRPRVKKSATERAANKSKTKKKVTTNKKTYPDYKNYDKDDNNNSDTAININR